MSQSYKEQVEALPNNAPGNWPHGAQNDYESGGYRMRMEASLIAATADAALAAAREERDALRAEVALLRKLHWLAARDHIFWSTYNEGIKDWDDGAHPAVLCNDIFLPGADGESLGLREFDAYLALCRKFDEDAGPAWCAAKRNMKPWRNFKLNAEAVVEAEAALAAIAGRAGA